MWSGRGGCDLGTNRELPDRLKCGNFDILLGSFLTIS